MNTEFITARQQLAGIFLCILLLAVVFELVRRRKLKEEYSFLWFGLCAIMLLMISVFDIVKMISSFFGIVLDASTLFLLGIMYLLIYAIFVSVKITTLTNQNKTLAQEVALLKMSKSTENAEQSIAPQE